MPKKYIAKNLKLSYIDIHILRIKLKKKKVVVDFMMANYMPGGEYPPSG